MTSCRMLRRVGGSEEGRRFFSSIFGPFRFCFASSRFAFFARSCISSAYLGSRFSSCMFRRAMKQAEIEESADQVRLGSS